MRGQERATGRREGERKRQAGQERAKVRREGEILNKVVWKHNACNKGMVMAEIPFIIVLPKAV